MNLKDFLATRDKPPELFWSLILEPGWVQAGIWYIEDGKAEVIGVSPGASWEVDSELIGAADTALSSSIQNLPENYSEPSKTVFGVPTSWVKEGEIKEEYLEKIKKVCTDLSLSPVGFVVLPEAIAHFYKSQEGSPLSAIVVGLGKDSLEITVFKLGNLVGTTSVARSVSLVEDVTEGLTRFEGASPLPSRIIIFDGKGSELEEAKETLIQASWESEKIKFLHTPKVEILAPERKVLATSLAGAAEIGDATTVLAKDTVGEQDLGGETPDFQQNVIEPKEDLTPQEMGFVVGEDVTNKEETIPPTSLPTTSPANISQVQPRGGVNTVGFFNKFISDVKNVFSPKMKIKSNSINKKTMAFFPAIATLVFLAAFAFWWFYPKAIVTIYVSPKNFKQDAKISFNTNGQGDLSNGIIPAQALTDQVSGEKTKATTGTKLIGDKASGTVQISNGNPSAINLSAGTFLTSSSGLKFITNADASVSGQLLPGSPGTAVVNVSAADIGSEYNLAKGEIFSVGNFSRSLVAATSQGDFSGGSSQQISAVSASDQSNLESDLKNELSNKALSDLSSKVDTTTQILVPGLAKADIATENFDHKIGDQADNLKLDISLDTIGLAADKTQLLNYAKSLLNDKTPGGYVLRDSQISFQFTFNSAKDNLYSYDVTIGANFLPQVNSDSIISKILGKTTAVVESYLSSIPGFVHAQVKLNPTLPSFIQTLPHIAKNITIDIVAQQ